MTPTEELRAKLDELGVEYTANDEKHVKETCWPYMGELMAVFAEYDNGTTRFACDTWCFTPEQAIAATVGPKITDDTSESFGYEYETVINVFPQLVPKAIRYTCNSLSEAKRLFNVKISELDHPHRYEHVLGDVYKVDIGSGERTLVMNYRGGFYGCD